MRYICWLIFFGALGVYPGMGQVVNTASIENDKGYLFVTGNTQFIQTKNLISIDSIQKVFASGKFQTLKSRPIIYVGHNPYHYSYRIMLYNPDSTSKKLIMMLGGMGIRKADIWKKNINQFTYIGATGYQLPLEERAYYFPRHSFAITQLPYAVDTIYIASDESHAHKTLSFLLLTEKQMKRMEHRFYFSFGMITGILLLFFLINIYMFIGIRQSIHLWYALYIAFMSFFILKHDGIDQEFLGMDSALAYRLSSMGGFAAIGMALLIHVFQLFLTNIPKSTLVYKIGTLFKKMLLISGIGYFIVFYAEPGFEIQQFIFQVSNIVTIMAYPLLTGMSIMSFVKGFKPAAFLLVGVSAFFIGGFSRAMFMVFPSLMMPPSLFQIGLAAEAIIISFGFMYKYSLYKIEKEAIQEAYDFQQIENTKNLMQALEAEQQRVAEELHDEIGGTLAAVKLHIHAGSMPDTDKKMIENLVTDAAQRAREIAHNLMPPNWEHTTLENLLLSYFNQGAIKSDIRFNFYYAENVPEPPKRQGLLLYRIILELTHNIIKHAMATEASVQIGFHNHHYQVIIEDNGIGIAADRKAGLGLKNIERRVTFLEGNMQIDTSSKGTHIYIHIPEKTMV